MNKADDSHAVLVFTGHAWEADMVKNILENEGIRAFLNNEHVGTLAPFYSTPGMGAVRVVVLGDEAERARAIVADFEKDRYEGDD